MFALLINFNYYIMCRKKVNINKRRIFLIHILRSIKNLKSVFAENARKTAPKEKKIRKQILKMLVVFYERK